MNDIKVIVSLIGLPASGKGTQAKILANKLNGAKIVGIGSLVREVIERDLSDPFFVEIKRRYDQGIPQPDSVAIDLVRGYLEKAEGNLILDNFPFGKDQANFLLNYIEEGKKWQKHIAVFINIDSETAVRRISTRRICSECGAIYSEEQDIDNICEKCGGAIVTRVDDDPEVVRTRIEHYEPVITQMRNILPTVVNINGQQSVEAVAKELEEELWKMF